MRFLGSFRVALGFLTIIPSGGSTGWPTTGRARAVAWFPAVGLLIGATLFALLLLPLPELPRAAIALIVWIVLTGGLHDDGWMDTLDAAFAPAPRDRRLKILKDPHVGAHAVSGAVLLQIARFAALSVVPAASVLVASVAGRTAMGVSLGTASPARSEGLGAALSSDARPLQPLVVGTAILVGIAWFWRPLHVPLAALTGGAVAAAWGLFLARRFGGLTGDGHGSLGVLAELVSLWAFVPTELRIA